MPGKSCLTCSFAYCEPDDDWTCGHPDANAQSGGFGIYVHRASVEGGHCGPSLPKYEPHPLRAPKVEAIPPGGDKLKHEPTLTIRVKAQKPKSRFEHIE